MQAVEVLKFTNWFKQWQWPVPSRKRWPTTGHVPDKEKEIR